MRKAARWPQAHRNGCGKAAAQDSQRKGSRACAAAVTKLRPASVRCGAEFFVSVLRRAAPVRRASNAQRMTEVAATDEVDVGYTLHDRRCGRCRSPSPAAAYVIPCFQFSMLLHNLSSEICRFRRIQVFHRLFHISAGFPQRLSFPLAFFERDRVRYAGSVGSSCSVRYATVLYGTVWYGAT